MESLTIAAGSGSYNANSTARAMEKGLKSTPKGFCAFQRQLRISLVMFSAKHEPSKVTGVSGDNGFLIGMGVYSVLNLILMTKIVIINKTAKEKFCCLVKFGYICTL